MARILIAEDDPRQAATLRMYLERERHDVAVVTDGRAALDLVRRGQTDAVLLDVMLPRLDGTDVCRILRAEKNPCAILMLTARTERDDVLLGLDLGADDYITKPYSLAEVMARLRAVLRRGRQVEDRPQVITVDGLTVDRARCEVRNRGVQVELTAKEFAILELLAGEPGRVFTRQQLLDGAFGFNHFALERAVDMHIMNIRRKIEPDPSAPSYLLTVRGRGYRLAEPSDAR